MREKPTFTGQPRRGDERDPDLCVVTCALTGVLASRKQCPNIPYTPVEIAEEARRAYDAGAAAVHIHARNDDGSPTFSPQVFARIKEEVRKRCPIILNFSTGTIADDVRDQCTYIREERPEIAALNMGTMNYSKYSKSRKQFDFDIVFPNTYDKIIKLLSAMNEAGVKPELEVFDTGNLWFVKQLIKEDLIPSPAMIQLCMGIPYGVPGDPGHLIAMVNTLPSDAIWSSFNISRMQMPWVAQSILCGGNVRVGLEDNLYLSRGVYASNAQLVEKARTIIEAMGARVMTPAQTREKLKIA